MDERKHCCVLARAREFQSRSTERRVRGAVEALAAEGKRPSFYEVAKRAQVARSTLYRNASLRRCVEEARAQFVAGQAPTAVSWETGVAARYGSSSEEKSGCACSALAGAGNAGGSDGSGSAGDSVSAHGSNGLGNVCGQSCPLQRTAARHSVFEYGICFLHEAA